MRRAWILALVLVIPVIGCDDDDTFLGPPVASQLALTGLEDLGPGFAYEGWVIVNGAPVSTGVFTVDGAGNPSDTRLNVSGSALRAATAFVLTIEPIPDPDPAPSAVHILGGDFVGNTATLSVGHPAALGDSFASAAGIFILASPTDSDAGDENSGLWFIDAGSPGLHLPALPAGWAYEGWAVIGGIPVTTGKFTDPAAADDAAPHSGPLMGPPFPGEDFLVNAPAGLTFPTDLAGGTAVISIEPSPDNSPGPFLLKPLVGGIPVGAVDHTPYSMGNNAGAFPTGMVAR